MEWQHKSVLTQESLKLFEGVKLQTFFDGTLGAGGHAEAFLTQHPEIESYIGCDRDQDALKIAEERLKKWGKKVTFVHANFSEIESIAEELKISSLSGCFFDLGFSSMQVDEQERGFSFRKQGPLDMRMDQTQDLDARQIVNRFSEKKIGEILKTLGEEPQWKKIARAIVSARRKKQIETTAQLADIVESALTRKSKKKLHPATLTFQALRMYVNRELESLEEGLEGALRLLQTQGVIEVISFHSIEDRIVKEQFRKGAKRPEEIFEKKDEALELLTKKPISASREETRKNPRSRSARLRAAKKIQVTH